MGSYPTHQLPGDAPMIIYQLTVTYAVVAVEIE